MSTNCPMRPGYQGPPITHDHDQPVSHTNAGLVNTWDPQCHWDQLQYTLWEKTRLGGWDWNQEHFDTLAAEWENRLKDPGRREAALNATITGEWAI